MTIKLSQSFIKFLVVGSCAFIIEYGTFYIFYENSHWHLSVANSVSFCLGLLTSFTLNRIWTFALKKKKYEKKAAHQFSYYAVLAIINFILTNLIVDLLNDAGFNPRYGKLVAMVTTSLWNYAFFKLIIFNYANN